jgi:hypothetical protein
MDLEGKSLGLITDNAANMLAMNTPKPHFIHSSYTIIVKGSKSQKNQFIPFHAATDMKYTLRIFPIRLGCSAHLLNLAFASSIEHLSDLFRKLKKFINTITRTKVLVSCLLTFLYSHSLHRIETSVEVKANRKY